MSKKTKTPKEIMIHAVDDIMNSVAVKLELEQQRMPTSLEVATEIVNFFFKVASIEEKKKEK